MHRAHETFLTIGELSALSGFKLPNGRRVPALSVKQLRVLERRGLFDTPSQVKMRGADNFPLVLWRRVPALPGKPRLFTGFDVACARLAGWMRYEGLGWSVILAVLRGRWSARYVLATTSLLGERDAELSVLPGGDGAVLRTHEIDAVQVGPHGALAMYRFPLAWLGMTGGTLSGLELDRVRDVALESWRWRHVPAELAAMELARDREERSTRHK